MPSKGFHRLSLHTEVRLKGAYFIRCEDVIRDRTSGEITELRCTYDPITKSGTGFTGRKVKGTIHWVSGEHAIKADINLYEKLLLDQEIPKDSEDWTTLINPDSIITIKDVLMEPYVEQTQPEQKFQFLRHGYFSLDANKYRFNGRLVFNRVVPLKDTWSRKER